MLYKFRKKLFIVNLFLFIESLNSCLLGLIVYLLLLLMIILANVSSTYILVCTAVLTFSCWDTIAIWIYVHLFVYIASWSYRRQNFLLISVYLLLFLFVFFWLLLVAFKQILAFVKVSLGTHLSLISTGSTCHRSLSIISCCWSSTIRSCACLVAEIIEIVEHQIHVFLFVLLQVMNDSLVFVDFDPDVSIGLARDGTGFHEVCTLILI